MAEYGISLTNFFVNDISVPEDDPAVVTLKQALAKRAEMELLGYTYVQERSFDTLEGAATNPGSTASDLMGAGLGLGMGIGMGGGVGGAFADVARNLNVSGSSRTCPSCGSAVPSGQKSAEAVVGIWRSPLRGLPPKAQASARNAARLLQHQ